MLIGRVGSSGATSHCFPCRLAIQTLLTSIIDASSDGVSVHPVLKAKPPKPHCLVAKNY
jgi:hypothetical protein